MPLSFPTGCVQMPLMSAIPLVVPSPNFVRLGLGCDDRKIAHVHDITSLYAAVNQDQGVFVYLTLNQSSKVEINVFDVLGRKVGNTVSYDLNSGKHNLPLIDSAARRLPQGQYFYKITTNGEKTYSKSFLVK